MLGQLLKPRWQHRNPAIRERAVANFDLDNADHLQHLATLARDDTSDAVRQAAVSRLTDLKLLGHIQQHDTAATVREAAAAQMQRLLAGVAEGAPGFEDRLRLIGLTDNAEALYFVALNAPEPACREAAVQRLEHGPTLGELALHGPDEPVRVKAAEKIDDSAVLRRLTREGRDKRVQRIARERLKDIQQREQALREARTQLEQLLDQLEQHARRTPDNLYEARLEQLIQRWQGVIQFADEGERQRAEEALRQSQTKVQARIDQHREQHAREAAAEDQRAAIDALEQLRRNLQAAHWEDLNSLRALVATQQRRWEAAAEIVAPTAPLGDRFAAILKLWQQLFELLAALQTGDSEEIPALLAQWPEGVPRPHAWQDFAPEPVTAEPAQPEQDPALRKLLGAVQGALRQKNLKQANRLWRRLEETLAQADRDLSWPPAAKLRSRLDELRDWHAFVAAPKKEALCAQMANLAATDMAPEEKAAVIQSLHDAWRELMSADQESDQTLWDRFRAASDQAYAPCREYFMKQDAIRNANLEKRRELCAQLQRFVDDHDWAHADWAQVYAIRRQAPQEWRQYQPVPFTETRQLGKQFHQLLETLDARLDETSANHRAQLETLAAEAEQLVDSEDPDAAAEHFKALQADWKKVGWVLPNQYRNLQKKFRKAGDRIFERLQATRQQQRDERREREAALGTLLDDARAQLHASPENLDVAALQQLVQQARDLANQTEDLDRRLADTLRKLEQQLRSTREVLPRWRRWHELRTVVTGVPDADESPAQRELAVAVEAAAGMESPAAARQERMQWQLEHLQAAMSGGQATGFDAVAETLQDNAVWRAGLAANIRSRVLAALATLEPRFHGIEK